MQNSIEVAVPLAEVFRYVADWQNAPHYAPAIGNLCQAGDIGYGCGTRLRGRATFKGLSFESVSEVVEFVENERIVCQSVSGVQCTNSWIFQGEGPRTTLTAIVTYRLPWRFVGQIAARLLAKEFAQTVTTSLLNLKSILEGRRDRAS